MGKSSRPGIIEKTRREVDRMGLQRPDGREQRHKYLLAVGPILRELADIGFEIDTLDDLRHQGKAWRRALPILLRWLPKVDDVGLKESIVRCLSVPWVGNKATGDLIIEFKKYAAILPKPSNPWVGKQVMPISDTEKAAAPAFSLAWAIGNALSIVDVKGFENRIFELCRNAKYGMSRQMLVLSLGRLRSLEAEETALNLLYDDDVRLHAIAALGAMKSKRALFELEKLLADKTPLIRKEARKAITRITR